MPPSPRGRGSGRSRRDPTSRGASPSRRDGAERSPAGHRPSIETLRGRPWRGRYRNPVDLTLLESTLGELGEPAYRAQQVWEWTARGASGYDAMTNLPRGLREELEANVPFSTLAVETERESRDGTVKV